MPKNADSSTPIADISHGKIPTGQLVGAAFALRRDIAAAQANLAEVEAALIARGAGKHTGNEDGHELTVIAALEGKPGKISYALTAENEKQARDLADGEFGNLFDRHVSFSCCDGFEKVTPKLLTPAKARDLIALCAVEGKATSARRAYILYPKVAAA